MIVNVRGEPRRLVAPFEHGGAEMHVVDMQDAALAEIEIGALTRPRLAGAPRQVVLAVMHDGEAAQHDVAEQVTPEMADRGHHPAHADRRADLFGLSGSSRSGPDHFLQRHDVGIDVAQDLDDAVRCGTAIHAAAPVNVVGRDSDVDGR
jgi:hypothetical protein